MRSRPATLLLAGVTVAGPLVAGVRVALDSGDGFPEVRARTAGSVCLLTVSGASIEDIHLYAGSGTFRPGLDELARLGVTVHRAYAAAGDEPAAIASLYTGRLPVTHGLRSFGQALAPDALTLAQALAQRGMRTALLSNVPLAEGLGLGRGFDHATFVPGASPAHLSRAARDWLTSLGDEYVFLWIHAHPDPAHGGDAAADLDALATGALDALREARRLEGTFVIATASRPRRPHHPVPLVVRIPTRHAAGQERQGPCSVLDLSLTLLHVFDRVGVFDGPGRSLIAGPRPLYSGKAFTDVALFEPQGRSPGTLGLMAARFALIDPPDNGPIRVYDPVADPDLTRDRLPDPAAQHAAALLRQELDRRRQRVAPPLPVESVDLPPETRDLLRRLDLP